MPTDVEISRELARAYWSGASIACPKHAGGTFEGSFVQTTFADHIFLTCSRGKETVTIPQRPKQLEFQPQQVEGFVENLQRGDAIRCYRCQSNLEIATEPAEDGNATAYTFTCVRCFSWGRWAGRPEQARIGKG
jgi:hypothetical protein